MKAISSRIVKTLMPKTRLKCIDNSGAKMLEIIAVKGFKGNRRAKPIAGVASLVFCKVRVGTEKVRHEVLRAVIVRQRKEYKRPDGIHIQFEENAAVVVDEKGDPKGTQIKGPIAKEVVERFPTIGKIASIVV